MGLLDFFSNISLSLKQDKFSSSVEYYGAYTVAASTLVGKVESNPLLKKKYGALLLELRKALDLHRASLLDNRRELYPSSKSNTLFSGVHFVAWKIVESLYQNERIQLMSCFNYINSFYRASEKIMKMSARLPRGRRKIANYILLVLLLGEKEDATDLAFTSAFGLQLLNSE